jgi:hypothetical protein
MALINVIPAASIYAVAIPGAPGKPAEVRLYDGNGDRFVGTVIPFPSFEGSVNVAMGDVDGDGILDLIGGAGKDHDPEVVVYAGASIRGKGTFGTELARFQPFDSQARGGVSVAAAQIDGTNADNIIVGSSPDIPTEVKVYQIPLAVSSSNGPALFAAFKPYGPEDRSGVSVATGFVDFSTGRESIVTAPGPGIQARVKVFAFPLLKPIGKADAGSVPTPNQPVITAFFLPFGDDYRGGVSLSTGWLAGSLGGAKRIVVSKLLQRLRARWRAVLLPAEPRTSWSRRTIPRDRELRAIRRIRRRASGHDQYDDRRQSLGQRRRARKHGPKRHQIRFRQAERAIDA